MRQLYTMATGGYTDPRLYDDAYANANYEKLKGGILQDAAKMTNNYMQSRGFGNGIDSPGVYGNISSGLTGQFLSGLWNTTQNNAMGWAGNARANNSDWIGQRNAEYAWDREEEAIKQRQLNQQKQNSFGGQLLGVASAAAPFIGAAFGGPAGYAIGQGVNSGLNSLGGGGYGGYGGYNSGAGGAALNSMNLYGNNQNPYALKFASGGIPNGGQPAVIVDWATGEVTGTMNEAAPEAIVPLNKMDRKELAALFSPRKTGGAVYDFSNGSGSKKKVPAYNGHGGVSVVNDQDWLKEAYELDRIEKKNWWQRNVHDRLEPIYSAGRTIRDLFGGNAGEPEYTKRKQDFGFPNTFDEFEKLSPEMKEFAFQSVKDRFKKLPNLVNRNLGKLGYDTFGLDRKGILRYMYGDNARFKDVPPSESGQSEDIAKSQNAAAAPAAGADNREAELAALYAPAAAGNGAAESRYRNPYDGLDYAGADSVRRPEYRAAEPRQTQNWVDVFAAAMAAYAPYDTAQMNQYADVGARSPLEGAAGALTGYRQRVKAEEAAARQEARERANDVWGRDWQTYTADQKTEQDKINRQIDKIKYDNSITEKERDEEYKWADLGLKAWQAAAKAKGEGKTSLSGYKPTSAAEKDLLNRLNEGRIKTLDDLRGSLGFATPELQRAVVEKVSADGWGNNPKKYYKNHQAEVDRYIDKLKTREPNMTDKDVMDTAIFMSIINAG